MNTITFANGRNGAKYVAYLSSNNPFEDWDVSQRYADLGGSPLLVRDLYGRIRIALPTDETTQHDDLAALFKQSLGNFSHQSVFLYKNELFDSDALLKLLTLIYWIVK